MNGFKGTINTNGRPQGIANKNTKIVRDAFGLLVENNLDKLQEDLDSLKPAERIRLILELASFVIPKLKSIEVEGNLVPREREPIIIQFVD